MTLKKINPTQTKSWKELQERHKEIEKKHLKKFFEEDPKRAKKFSIQWEEFYLDYSKNKIDENIMNLLLKLAEETGLKEAIAGYFQGDIINQTEERAVLHTALRAEENQTIYVEDVDVIPEINTVKQKIKSFTSNINSGIQKGYTGKPFTDVVNIGIGGSDLGPVMVTEALHFYKNKLTPHFISNVDGDHVLDTIRELRPETTLFVIVSKSFTTQETLTNAQTIRKWFLQHAPEEAIANHFIAVSTNLPQIKAFGIDKAHTFPMWDWVGGRFSLWSAVGLSIALVIGYDNFEKLLKGARKMDLHFKTASFDENMPVILAMLSIWYANFFNAETEALIPYSHYLRSFPAYLQQAVMESNGKSVDRHGNPTPYQTGTIVWGAPGTNAQHAFFQLLHQGTKLIPTDFIGCINSLHGNKEHHQKLMANFFAQTEALLHGKTKAQVISELKAEKLSEAAIAKRAPFKVFEGDKPTNTLLIRQLTPENLGALIALYEHKIFVQGVIWNIFSYDQWGVELGKQLANTILKDLRSNTSTVHDTSTTQLLRIYKEKQQ